MASTVIGLDIGTTAVRAAEVRPRRNGAVLERFGQVALPAGAVVAGEVVDAAAVAAALKRLWREAGFKSKRVVTGVAGQRVVGRTTEVPAMSDADVRSSLAFQVQDLIPIPLEEAVIDHQVLEPVAGEDGTELLRIFVVAAHRDVLRSLMAALDGAGLSAERIDLIPFALVRSLHTHGFEDLAGDGEVASAEAIVDIGGGLTNVVVHEHGVPRLVRSLTFGGGELTDAIAMDLDVGVEDAESLKRRIDDDTEVLQAQQVADVAIAPVLEDIRTTLEFWQAQNDEALLRRVVVTGGGARLAAVELRLEQALGVPVVHGRPFGAVDVASTGLSADDLARAEDVAAVAIGLALSGESLGPGVRRISLVPSEVAVQQRERKQAMAVAGGVAAFAALLLGLYVLRASSVSDAKADADAAEARTTELQGQVAQLQDVEALEADVATRRQTAVAALAGDVAWLRLLNEVATVLPNDVWLTNFAGTAATVPSAGTTAGTVSFGITGFEHTSTAHWLVRLSDLASLNGLWVPGSNMSGEAGGRDLVTFTSTANLTPSAGSTRAQRIAEGG